MHSMLQLDIGELDILYTPVSTRYLHTCMYTGTVISVLSLIIVKEFCPHAQESELTY